MRKKITIGNKEYEMQSSAYTQFKYKDETGRSLIKDLSNIANRYEKIKDSKDAVDQYEELDDFLTITLRIAFIMSLEAKSFSGTYEDYLKEIDDYLSNTDWISEVVNLAISPLSRNVQTTQNQ